MNSKSIAKEKFVFKDMVKVENILSNYPDKKSATLPLLHLAQSQDGYITTGAINTIADLLDYHPAIVMDCVSFYTMLYTKAQGKYKVQICQTLSCSLNGADALVDHMQNKCGIKAGETTPDEKYTLMKVECLGSCDTAPVVQINNDYYEGLSREKFDELLETLK